MDNAMKWSFGKIWNDTLEENRERKMEPRERIWASEIGGSFVDRYLKMTGVQPTNPPNARSLRKFEAGRIWECIVGYVLSRAGILISFQKWVKFEYPGLLPVTGKLDYIAGGNPDYDKAANTINNEFNWLPEFVTKATLNIVNKLKEQYPNGLTEVTLEIKSCSAFMFELYERNGTGSPQHKCQDFHYLKAENRDEGHIVYISRDDARILEIPVFNPSVVENLYKTDIQTITNYLKNNEQPPNEKFIVYDADLKKFSANWKVAYSQYLTMLYNFRDQAEFDETYKPVAERWNRVLGRVARGEKMTDKNKAALEEMAQEGFDVQQIISEVTKNG